jgi:hypothetical protein
MMQVSLRGLAALASVLRQLGILPEPSTFARSQFERCADLEVAEGIFIPVASAEDVLLSKLVWYRKTHQRSEKQWRDVVGIVTIKGPELDLGYLKRWAPDLGVDDLLRRLLMAAGPG